MEPAIVSLASGNQIQLTQALKLDHPLRGPAPGIPGIVAIAPGFFGPQPGFDVTQPVNKEIVPYYSIIE